MVGATMEMLGAVEGVGPKTAEGILTWAAEQAPAAEPEPEGLAGDAFMAALSEALAESEQLRESAAAYDTTNEKLPADEPVTSPQETTIDPKPKV
jgi:hypothetical protein